MLVIPIFLIRRIFDLLVIIINTSVRVYTADTVLDRIGRYLALDVRARVVQPSLHQRYHGICVRLGYLPTVGLLARARIRSDHAPFDRARKII